MSTVCSSIYLGLLWFLSSAFVIFSYRFYKKTLSVYLSFIFFGMIISDIVFLLVISSCLSLVSRNRIGFIYLFCIFQPCWTYLITFFFCRLFGIFNVDNHVICNVFSFTSSFPIWMSFIPFTCLITAVRICNTTLTKSGEEVLGQGVSGYQV